MNKWHYQASMAVGNDFSPAYPDAINVNAGIIPYHPMLAIDEADGSLSGILADIKEIIEEQAGEDGTSLMIDADTANPWTGTFNDAINPLSYNMMLADYYQTSERSQIVTFLPAFLETYLTSFKVPDGPFDTLEAAKTGGGSVCLWAGTSIYDSLAPEIANVVACLEAADCADKLVSGACDIWVDDFLGQQFFISENDIDAVSTEEVIGDTIFVTNPVASDLDPTTMVLLNKWYNDAAAAGKFEEVLKKWYQGGADDDDDDSAMVKALIFMGIVFGVCIIFMFIKK